MEIDVQTAISWLNKANEKMQAEKDYLTKLDQETGDGDHGINMARGFSEVENKIANGNYETCADVFKDTAMTLMSKIGGASGPLYGTAFLRLSTALKGQDPVDEKAFAQGVQAALEGIQQRGKASVGEKTMVDVWQPIAAYLQETSAIEAAQLEKIAKEAMEATKDLIATKGRAAYFKERSKGAIDPGAASSFYLFSALAEVLKEAK
ncbi:dihydroxyacetone kinase subunit DhaL [Virgibacillus sp. 179-BFC.A HS]|uniref:Dihydroxyacetone kinase subunit DhaL n=1 Tax=Tigheibacillus jepli TaxID=3035914 RepID=A0ABU5CGM8_9BACI|nr:dihydroxyacetone kinase subunit DhaL [Virgibacillus sp. 179-BFC.A HS]MDY0404999.1 dihydroxyacetone kinase subunit DhaL [Virgibacillus sp. 179-BFC.A HS]